MRYVRPAGRSRRVSRRKWQVLEETGVEERKPRICHDEERKSVGRVLTTDISTAQGEYASLHEDKKEVQ